ncbi:MAG: DNA polymerase III subunit gamma/tau [Candidatus Peregrinibacteria bacterium Greene0416_62]|nr:MAG: DNA polymerase III subunit gamma/tau [Candidatus Peregrinibacteria bacterium Greene0416_62]
MSLYRKYRPLSFADVVGQDHIVTTLEQAARLDKLSHAYLFAGGRGTGKTSVARILAKIIMIRGIEDERIQQQIIKGVEEGSIVDLLEIDAASNTGVDNIRDLIEKIQFSPVAAGAKVYIIDEVHMLSKGAFNALLKTLEEPPPYAFFILATTELQKIPATIQSRCQCFPFRSIREEDIVRRLQYIADQERLTIDREAVRVIARHGGGALRDAISLLDQLRSLPKITVEDVLERVGGTREEEVQAVLAAIDAGDRSGIIDIVRRVEEAGTALDGFLRQILGALRTAMHGAIERKEPIDQSLAMMDALLHAIRDVRIAPVPGLILESALLSLCNNTAASASGLAKREEKPIKDKAVPQKEGSTETAREHAPAAIKDDEAKAPTPTAATIEAPEVTMESVQKFWGEVVNAASPPSVKMSLKNGRITSVQDGKITLGFPSSFHKEKVASTEASRKIEEILEKIFNRQLPFVCVLDGQKDPTKEEPLQEAVNLAEAAAEIF